MQNPNRLFADDWGGLVGRRKDKIVRQGKLTCLTQKGKLLAYILLSHAVMITYNLVLAGTPKAYAMNTAFGDFISMFRDHFRRHLQQGDIIKSVNILFGGRPFKIDYWFKRYVDPTAEIGYIALKNERVPDKNGTHGWGIECWGFAPEYDFNAEWRPMTPEEKKAYPFLNIQQVIDRYGIDYFCADVLIAAEGALASGETASFTFRTIFDILKEHNKPLPKEVWVYVNFGSIHGGFEVKKVCEEYGVEYNIVYAGSAAHVAEEAVLPGLPYTDLLPLDSHAVTYRTLFLSSLKVCMDLNGNPIYLRCSCLDIGKCLDEPDEHIVDLVIVNLILRTHLSNEGLMLYWDSLEFCSRVKDEIERMQEQYNTVLYNTVGEKIWDIVNDRIRFLGEKKDQAGSLCLV